MNTYMNARLTPKGRELLNARLERGEGPRDVAVALEVSYGAVWAFVHAEGLSFKKNRAGQRTKPSRRRPAAPTMEEISSTN